MGRRRRKRSSAAEDLATLPWQVSAVLAVLSFAGIRWLPQSFFSNTHLAVLLPTFHLLSWFALGTLSFISLIAFIRSKVEGGNGRKPDVHDVRIEPCIPADAWPVRLPDPPGQPHAWRSAETNEPAEHLLPRAWTLDALCGLEWKRFELLCARYYEAVGFRTETLAAGPDGGIDVKLFKADSARPIAVVQCKAWSAQQVGVKEIRELLGVMAHSKVGRGVFLTTGTYTRDAQAFGTANPIQLLDGAAFVRKLTELPPAQQQTLLQFAFAGDWRTPTCPSCGIKLIARESKRGPFWGCAHYPRCRSTLPMQNKHRSGAETGQTSERGEVLQSNA